MALSGNKENLTSSTQRPFVNIKTGEMDSEFSARNFQGPKKQGFSNCRNNENDKYSKQQSETTKTANLGQASLRPTQQRRALGDITNRDKPQSQQSYSREQLKQNKTNPTIQKSSGAYIAPTTINEEIEYMPKESVQDLCSPELEIDMNVLKQSVQKWKNEPFSYLGSSKNESTFHQTDEISIELEDYDIRVESEENSWSIRTEEDPLPTFSLPHVQVHDPYNQKYI